MKRMFWCKIEVRDDWELATYYNEGDEKICEETVEKFVGTNRIFSKKEIGRPKPYVKHTVPDELYILEVTVIHGFTYDSDEETDIEERKKEIRKAARNEVRPMFKERMIEIAKNYDRLMGE